MIDDYDQRGPEECAKTALPAILRAFEEYIPASKEEISDYRESRYPAWLKECKSIFQEIDVHLTENQPPMTFSFRATNDGTWPANHARATISAKGDFRILSPREGLNKLVQDREIADRG